MVLSALTKGMPPKELDPLSLHFLQSCAKDMALKLAKEDIKKETEFLQQWKLDNLKMCTSYGKKVC